MPGAKVHRHLTLLAQFCSLSALFLPVTRHNISFFIAFQAGILVTYWVTPDADIAQRLGSVGSMLGLEDYESEMPHRYGFSISHWRESWVKALVGSHIPLFGTFVRLSPIILLVFGVLLLGGIGNFIWLLAFLLGSSWSDLWHVVADLATTKVKRWVRGRRSEWHGTSIR